MDYMKLFFFSVVVHTDDMNETRSRLRCERTENDLFMHKVHERNSGKGKTTNEAVSMNKRAALHKLYTKQKQLRHKHDKLIKFSDNYRNQLE